MTTKASESEDSSGVRAGLIQTLKKGAMPQLCDIEDMWLCGGGRDRCAASFNICMQVFDWNE